MGVERLPFLTKLTKMKLRTLKHKNMVFPIPTFWAREYKKIVVISLSFITFSIQLILKDEKY